jgi:hypothetical protein
VASGVVITVIFDSITNLLAQKYKKLFKKIAIALGTEFPLKFSDFLPLSSALIVQQSINN